MAPKKISLPWFFLIILLITSSCSLFHRPNPHTISYDSFPRRIPIPELSKEQKDKFNYEREGDFVRLDKPGGESVSGYVTDNMSFLEEVMAPSLEPHMEDLSRMHPVEMMNTLLLFSHETYRTYFSTSYFSWGGDLLDLDDPQEKGPNFKKRYGFDCSGFASMPYELAVYLDLLKAEEDSAVFSSKGFAMNAKKHGLEDKGGRGGTSNRFRVDTADMKNLGRDILTIEENTAPTPEDVEKMQAGDIVLLPKGHAGIIAEIQGQLYYLEAGGIVCPPNGGLPFEITEALTMFSQQGELVIKRSLQAYGRIADLKE